MSQVAGLPYNGWPPSVRFGRGRHFAFAVRNRLLPEALRCTGCQLSFEGSPHYHAEEYGPTVQDYWSACTPLCIRCHAMIHARFVRPMRWLTYLEQVDQGSIDERVFPRGTNIAASTRKFKSLPETAPALGTRGRIGYLASLPGLAYDGPEKVATLFVWAPYLADVVEVPDWLIYGPRLQNLTDENRSELERRGISIERYFEYVGQIAQTTEGAPALSSRLMFAWDLQNAGRYNSALQDVPRTQACTPRSPSPEMSLKIN